jgi:hypothetical protein
VSTSRQLRLQAHLRLLEEIYTDYIPDGISPREIQHDWMPSALPVLHGRIIERTALGTFHSSGMWYGFPGSEALGSQPFH